MCSNVDNMLVSLSCQSNSRERTLDDDRQYPDSIHTCTPLSMNKCSMLVWTMECRSGVRVSSRLACLTRFGGVLLPGQAQGYGAHWALCNLWATVDSMGWQVRTRSSLKWQEQTGQNQVRVAKFQLEDSLPACSLLILGVHQPRFLKTLTFAELYSREIQGKCNVHK